MSDRSERDMERADIANGEGDPDQIVPPEQDPDAGYPSSTGVVDDQDEDENQLPPLGQELEAD